MGHKVRVYYFAVLWPGLDMRNLRTEEQGSVWAETPDWQALKVSADLLCHTALWTVNTAHLTVNTAHCQLHTVHSIMYNSH